MICSTLARTDSSQLQLQISNFSLDVLLLEVSGQFRFLAETKNISIDTDIQVPMSFAGDEGRIRQLLIILLDNALKFTSESRRITIASHFAPHSVVVRIEDTWLRDCRSGSASYIRAFLSRGQIPNPQCRRNRTRSVHRRVDRAGTWRQNPHPFCRQRRDDGRIAAPSHPVRDRPGPLLFS